MPMRLNMIETIANEQYISEGGSRMLERSYGMTVVDEDGNEFETNGHWMYYAIYEDGSREGIDVGKYRSVLAERFGLEYVD